MPKQNNYQPWQTDVVLRDHRTSTSKQLSERSKLPLWKVYEICKANNIQPVKPKDFRAGLNGVKGLIQRPPAIYSNSSPYGIATALHQGKMF